MLNAVRIAVDKQSRGKGAVIALNDRINAAREVTKAHTSNVETFESGDAGFLGEVNSDRVVYWRSPTRRQHVALTAERMPYVEIVPMYGGADGHLVEAAVAHGARGLVIQSLGMGNVNKPMYRAIQQAIGKGVAVVISTRVPHGRVLPHYGYDGGGQTLVAAGAVMGDDLSPQKARILLMLLLQSGVTAQKDCRPLRSLAVRQHLLECVCCCTSKAPGQPPQQVDVDRPLRGLEYVCARRPNPADHRQSTSSR